VSIRLKPGPTTRIEGRLTGYQNTTVVPGQVIVQPPDDSVSFARTVPIEKDGRFVIPGLAKGKYRLLVAPRRGPDPLMWADEPVTIIGEPVRRLVIPLQPTLAIGGEFSFKGRPAMLYDTRTFLTINAEYMPDRSDIRGLWPLAWTSVLPDGKFAITGLVPGQYRISVSGAEPWGWRPKSALYLGAPGEGARLEPIDLFDAPITIERGRNVFGVTIEMTNLTTTVAGKVESVTGRPVSRAAVTVFSVDSRFWTPGSRRYRSVVTDAEGAFRIEGLPEGDYLAVSPPSLQPPSPNPQVLDTLRARAVAFSLSEGGTKELVLRPGGL
jgi:hypothetical protein